MSDGPLISPEHLVINQRRAGSVRYAARQPSVRSASLTENGFVAVSNAEALELSAPAYGFQSERGGAHSLHLAFRRSARKLRAYGLARTVARARVANRGLRETAHRSRFRCAVSQSS